MFRKLCVLAYINMTHNSANVFIGSAAGHTSYWTIQISLLLSLNLPTSVVVVGDFNPDDKGYKYMFKYLLFVSIYFSY
jgi:hypothetical protein